MRHRWIGAWLLQIVLAFAVGVAAALAEGVSAPLGAAGRWGLVPLAGLATACLAVRMGLLNYAAWLAPPACYYGAHMLVWGYSPSAGAALLTALLSLVGAAAGEVLNQRKPR